MPDLGVIHRRSLTWVWWLVGVLLIGGLIWFATTSMQGEATDLEAPDEAAPPAAAAAEADAPL